MTRLKKQFKSPDFTYFIRYLGLFTLIFVAMTLIILQVMRTSVYQSTDDNLKSMAEDPNNIINWGLVRATDEYEITKESLPSSSSFSENLLAKPSEDLVETEFNPEQYNLDVNTSVVLFDAQENIVYSGDPFSGFGKVKWNSDTLGEVKETEAENYYGGLENYRYIVVETDGIKVNNKDIKYAMAVVNTSQLKQTSESYESTVVLVMMSFWMLSIFASMWLSNITVRPILLAYEKQKAFVENASHELRTPLTVLQNRLENLFHNPDDSIIDSSESISASLDEVRNMRLLTSNLLELARREDGIKPVFAELTPEYFEPIFENYEIIAEENNKRIRTHNHATHSFKSDHILLKQLLTILFDNAIKYTDSDGDIEISVRTTDKHLLITVADNGPGISDRNKKKIFDRFYRVDKARTRQKGGFGLGLSLAKQIAESLRGAIAVKDNQPKGTVFVVKFNRTLL